MDTLRRTGGRLVTSVPQTPIRCGGAPVIMAYLFDDQARSAGTRDRVHMHYYTALGTLLGQPDFNRDIQRRFGERDIGFSFRQRLTGIDIGARRATFTVVAEGGGARPEASCKAGRHRRPRLIRKTAESVTLVLSAASS